MRKQRAWDLLRDSYSRPARPRRTVATRVLAPLAAWAFDINVPLRGREGLRVLDVGCGFGDLLIYLKSRGCEVAGVDLDARAAAVAAQAGVSVTVGHLQQCSFAEASYDTVVMCHSLEHVSDPLGDLKACVRLLRPGGILHVAVPNGASAGLKVDAERWIHLSVPLHFWFFDPESLTAMMSRAGLEIVKTATTSRWHHLGVSRHQAMNGQPLRAASRLARIASIAFKSPDSGDVLRVIARKPKEPLSIPLAS